MSQIYRPLASCLPSQSADVYIYAILPVADQAISAITSADELLFVDGTDLQSNKVIRIQHVPKGLTSLAVADAGRTSIVGGHEGSVAIFDLRTQKTVAQFQTGGPVNALACRDHDLAIGYGSVVAVWDRRQNKMRWQNRENNDEITVVDYHPSRSNILLSGGDDGMVSIYDTQIVEEDDSLLQAINHGPVHRAGFLGQENLFALSSDQNLALHSLTLEDVGNDEPAADQLGDLRPLIPCEYVIDVFLNGHDYVVACGSHSKSRIDLVKVDRGSQLSLDQRIVLEDAHAGEIVRSIYADENNGVIYTAGEDGRITAFRPTAAQALPSTPSRGTKNKRGSDGRYKPY